MTSPVALGWVVAAMQLAIWVGAALLAWPDHLELLATPWVATFVMFGLAGVLLVARRPRHPIGWVMLGFGVLSGLGVSGLLVASRLLAADAVTAAAWADASGSALMTMAILAIPILLALFPEGGLSGRSGRFLLWLIGAVAAMGAAAALLNGGWGGDPNQAIIESPLRADTQPWGDVFAQIFYIGMGISIVWASALLIRRWRRSTGTERQQIKWLAMAATMVVLALIASGLNTTEQWEIVVVATALSLIPVAILIAVLRYRLYEIDRLISRTLTYGLVVGLLGLVFVGLVTISATFLPSDNPLVVAVATLAVATLFNPVRRRIQRFVDVRFNRSRHDAERVIEDFTGRLQGHADPELVVGGWVGVVEQIMEPEIVGVWVRPERSR